MKFNVRPLIIAVITIMLSLSFGALSTTKAQQSQDMHTVQAGESLFSIARQYDLAVGDIREWNDLDNDNLSVGQVLKITPPEADNQITHTVRPGDTLFSLSRRYDVTIAEIQQWNNLESATLSTGTELTIYQQNNSDSSDSDLPDEIEESEPDSLERVSIVQQRDSGVNTYHTVRSGDSLYKIANEYGLTVDELKELNNLETDMLRVGQRLTVPSDQPSAPSVAEGSEESTPQGRFAQYRVQSGENTESILEKFEMSEDELYALNPGLSSDQISSGQRVTVLLPPTRSFDNPYRSGSELENLGSVSVFRYSESDVAGPTTSGELYNPEQLTAAHPNIALGKVIYIENSSSGQGIFVRINDRHSGDGLKLSNAAYEMLSFTSIEDAQVTIYLDD